MISIRFVPVERWPVNPTAQHDRERSLFRAPYCATLDLLDKELFQLDAKSVLIQAYFGPGNIRNDGWPYSTASPRQPGIILSFAVLREQDSKWQELSFPCDRFENWEDNLRAIALALEALCKVDRYGVTQRSEQYTGWAKLPPPANNAQPEMTRQQAAQYIANLAGIHESWVHQDLDGAYRAAAKKVHPDSGGSHEAFVRLQRARDILGGRV